MAVRCCCPPESSSTSWLAWSARPSRSSDSIVRRRASGGLTPQATSATCTFSPAVRMGARPLSCGTITTCSVTAWSRLRNATPSTETDPLTGRTRPAMAHSRRRLAGPGRSGDGEHPARLGADRDVAQDHVAVIGDRDVGRA